MTFKEMKEDPQVQKMIAVADRNLEALGYTEHSIKHCMKVAKEADRILETLGLDKKERELAKIAGLMHDIGNCINRNRHAEYGAILADRILEQKNMDLEDRLLIISAIGHHDESTGGANDIISAALIVADKTDVRRDRVRDKGKANFDIHDRVNYAVCSSQLKINKEKKEISLHLEIDEKICTMYEYFEIFLGRMMMCRKASEILGCTFKLMANGRKVL